MSAYRQTGASQIYNVRWDNSGGSKKIWDKFPQRFGAGVNIGAPGLPGGFHAINSL